MADVFSRVSKIETPEFHISILVFPVKISPTINALARAGDKRSLNNFLKTAIVFDAKGW